MEGFLQKKSPNAVAVWQKRYYKIVLGERDHNK